MSAPIRDIQTLFEAGPLAGLADGPLLERFATRRDEAAFEAIVRRHGPMGLGVCRRVLRDRHDAEDAFQATFLVLARKAAEIAHGERLGPWLYGVALRTATKARATLARRQGREGRVADLPEPEAPKDGGGSDDRVERLDREIGRLPDRYRIPVVLCELGGMSHTGEQEAILPLGKGKQVSDLGTTEMCRQLLQVAIRHCWQSSKDGGRRQEVLIPSSGAFAAVLYSKQHGDLLLSCDEKTATAFSFTNRKRLYERK